MAEAKITVHVDASAFAAGLREALDLIDFTALDPRPVRRFPSLHDPAIFSAERHMGSVRVRAAVVLHMGSAAVVLHGATVEIVPWPQAGA